MTHTYATLAVSKSAYEEIKARLLEVSYGHTINSEGEIDMHGIALIPESQAFHDCGRDVVKIQGQVASIYCLKTLGVDVSKDAKPCDTVSLAEYRKVYPE